MDQQITRPQFWVFLSHGRYSLSLTLFHSLTYIRHSPCEGLVSASMKVSMVYEIVASHISYSQSFNMLTLVIQD